MTYHRFAITQGRASVDNEITDSEYRTLAVLSQYADRDGWCWPAQETLADDRGISRKTVNEHIGKLYKLGYIDKKPRFTESGGQTSNMYKVLYDVEGVSRLEVTPSVTPRGYTNDSSNDSSNMGTDVPDQFPLEWKIQAGKAITSLPKEDNEMLKVSEVIAKSFKDNYKLAVDILMAFQKTRGIMFLYEDQKKHKKALATLIKSGVKPEHVITATKELMKAKYTVTDLFSISKTAINLANPMPAENKPKKYITAYEE